MAQRGIQGVITNKKSQGNSGAEAEHSVQLHRCVSLFFSLSLAPSFPVCVWEKTNEKLNNFPAASGWQRIAKFNWNIYSTESTKLFQCAGNEYRHWVQMRIRIQMWMRMRIDTNRERERERGRPLSVCIHVANRRHYPQCHRCRWCCQLVPKVIKKRRKRKLALFFSLSGAFH